MWKYHLAGGVVYMIPLTILFLLNIGLIAYALFRSVQEKPMPAVIQPAITQVAGLALAWGVFATVVALFQAFQSLSEMQEPPPFAVIMGGLKVGFITTLYGLIIFVISMAANLGLRVWRRNSAAG